MHPFFFSSASEREKRLIYRNPENPTNEPTSAIKPASQVVVQPQRASLNSKNVVDPKKTIDIQKIENGANVLLSGANAVQALIDRAQIDITQTRVEMQNTPSALQILFEKIAEFFATFRLPGGEKSIVSQEEHVHSADCGCGKKKERTHAHKKDSPKGVLGRYNLNMDVTYDPLAEEINSLSFEQIENVLFQVRMDVFNKEDAFRKVNDDYNGRIAALKRGYRGNRKEWLKVGQNCEAQLRREQKSAKDRIKAEYDNPDHKYWALIQAWANHKDNKINDGNQNFLDRKGSQEVWRRYRAALAKDPSNVEGTELRAQVLRRIIQEYQQYDQVGVRAQMIKDQKEADTLDMKRMSLQQGRVPQEHYRNVMQQVEAVEPPDEAPSMFTAASQTPEAKRDSEGAGERAVRERGSATRQDLATKAEKGNAAAAQMLEKVQYAATHDPEDQAFQLARANSVLDWQRNTNMKNEIAAGIEGIKLGEYTIDLGKYAYRTITVELPENLNDPAGANVPIDFKPYLFDRFEEMHDAVRAKEAGIRIMMDRFPDGRPRGVKFEFTKEGLFVIAGKMVPIGNKGKNQEKQRKDAMEKAQVFRSQDVYEEFGQWGKMRVLQIFVNNNETLRIDTRDIQDEKPYKGAHGVRVTRVADGRLRIDYQEHGNYKVAGRWGMDRQQYLGEIDT